MPSTPSDMALRGHYRVRRRRLTAHRFLPNGRMRHGLRSRRRRRHDGADMSAICDIRGSLEDIKCFGKIAPEVQEPYENYGVYQMGEV
jgi:hypothetical protein